MHHRSMGLIGLGQRWIRTLRTPRTCWWLVIARWNWSKPEKSTVYQLEIVNIWFSYWFFGFLNGLNQSGWFQVFLFHLGWGVLVFSVPLTKIDWSRLESTDLANHVPSLLQKLFTTESLSITHNHLNIIA